ncbi:MAG: hypothetical protein OXC46_10715 [Thaumarchaeota archaeon]|nr:hypothetical protein [Nitrososphaerota archaeon]
MNNSDYNTYRNDFDMGMGLKSKSVQAPSLGSPQHMTHIVCKHVTILRCHKLKDYEHVIVWLDYFNKTFPRAKGRRLDKKKCVFDPSMKELAKAAQSAGFEVTSSNDKVRYPKRPHVKSGYIAVPKVSSKTKILDKISEKLVLRRAK